MRHRQIRKQLASDIRRLLKNLKSLPLMPRDYQKETLQSLVKWLEDAKGTKRAYINHATGMGKTYQFSMIASACLDLNVLVIVPNRLLVKQTVGEIVGVTGGTVGHISTAGKIKDADGEIIATRGHNGHRIVVTTDHSFKLHTKKFAKEFGPHLIIRDECHWGYSEKSTDALDLFSEAVIIGYSATPDYLTTTAKSDYIPVKLDNGQTLYAPPDRVARAHFGTMLDQRTLRWGIEHEYLAPLAWGTISFNFSLDDVPVTNGPAGTDYDEYALHKLLAENWDLMEGIICRLYKENQYDLRNRQVFAMCPGVAQAESLARKLGRFVKTACITGDVDDDERDKLLASFDKDKLGKDDIRFIASVFVLREGWNARNAEVCMMLRPTRSRVLYEQFMGRGTRLRRDGKKKVMLVLDAHFQGTTFSPLSAPVLYGVAGQSIVEGDILIPQRRRLGKGRIISPYMLKRAKPKLHVVKAAEIEYWAGPDGFLSADGETWGTVSAFSRRLGFASVPLLSRIGSCRSREAKDPSGKVRTFYALKDVEKACADLLKKIPQANADGFFKADGELWGTRGPIASRLGLLSIQVLSKRIDDCRSREGKDASRKVRTFYALKDAEKACADLLKKIPQANADGFFKADGELWGTSSAVALKLKLSTATISKRLKSFRSKKGRKLNGRIYDFYAVNDAERLLKGLLKKVPQANADGFFKADGELWGSIAAYSRRFNLSHAAIADRFNSSFRSQMAKDPSGKVRTFYALKDVEKACADLLKKIPQANADGFFRADGELWGSLRPLASRLKLSRHTMGLRIKSCRSRQGKDASGRIQKFHSLKEVEKACVDLFKKLPQANADGFFRADGELWGTIGAFAKRLKFSFEAVSVRVKHCRSRRGRGFSKQNRVFYALKDVEKACSDLLKKKSKSKKKKNKRR